MKKMIALIGAAALAVSMAACSASSDGETAAPSTDSTTQSTTQATTEATTSPTTEPVEKFEEIVLVDNEQIVVKIIGVEDDPIWGYTLKVYLENKTDKELMFSVNDVSVNGFMCDPFWAETVAAGKRSNTSISWLVSDFEDNGIETVEDISFTLHVYDSNDWMADDIFNETITVKP